MTTVTVVGRNFGTDPDLLEVSFGFYEDTIKPCNNFTIITPHTEFTCILATLPPSVLPITIAVNGQIPLELFDPLMYHSGLGNYYQMDVDQFTFPAARLHAASYPPLPHPSRPGVNMLPYLATIISPYEQRQIIEVLYNDIMANWLAAEYSTNTLPSTNWTWSSGPCSFALNYTQGARVDGTQTSAFSGVALYVHWQFYWTTQLKDWTARVLVKWSPDWTDEGTTTTALPSSSSSSSS
eukprot:TRINITY_DN11954_c1_g1_i2.p1 TRINITY_DN11954_c1_g1~~TRINITY_DN11954_c1_g1_i2.p1  ORF type:complete len:238 (+),score=33.34 TRINITY_DN11954_c1_g1_i2:1-714(+)